MNHWVFVVPDPFGHPSGGTRYNAALVRELRAVGVRVATREPAAMSFLDDAEWVWLDSLYLRDVVRLAARARELGARRVGLLLHYLPSLVRTAGNVAAPLADEETQALAVCDAVLVTSEYMATALARAGFRDEARVVAPPGCEWTLDRAVPSTRLLRALMVAHVVPGKQIFEFLQALADELSREDDFELEIAGAIDVDPEYFGRCRAFVERTPVLEGRVTFLGVLREAVLGEKYARANLVVSASRMESYGMALAEARTMGLPVFAIPGGNVGELVDARAGGKLCGDLNELARCCVHLARSARDRAALLALARAHARPRRAWARVAEEFLAGVAALASPPPP